MYKNIFFKYVVGICVTLLVIVLNFYNFESLQAQEFSTTNYKVYDSVIVPSEFSTSAGFKLWSTISEIAIGTSTSLSFGINSGSLYFPFASSPAVSATAGTGSVSLSWTASTGYLGWNVSSYKIAQSTVSGGPYSYTSVGNVTSSSVTGLTGGTTYYFVIVASDAFGNPVASSTEISSIPSSQGSSGSGGGSSGGSSDQTGVIFSGRAYPMSKVSILKDGQLVLTTIAGPDSVFSAQISGISSGNYNFSLYGQDKDNIKSSPFTFPIYITQGITTTVSGIFIAPTISVDKAQVARGENVVVFGQTTPEAEVTININSNPEYFIKSPSDKDGVYLLNFDTAALDLGSHSAKSKTAKGVEVSYFSNTVGFKVGDKTILADLAKCASKGDLNSDCKVNLIDFSIAAYWYKQSLGASFKEKESLNLNGDDKIDLVDFSIMAYNWTG